MYFIYSFFNTSKQILDLKCSFFLLSLWFFPPLAEDQVYIHFLESPREVGNKLSDSQACLSRKSVMAFHSVHSIPPLCKDTRTWWRDGFTWNSALAIWKWLLSFQQLWSEHEDPKGLSVLMYSFCIYFLLTPPHAFHSPLPQTTRAQSIILDFQHFWNVSF